MTTVKRIVSFLLCCVLMFGFAGCGGHKEEKSDGLSVTGSLKLSYATQFSVDYYDGGYKMISLADGSRFFIVPEGKELPAVVDKDAVPLYQPITNIYLAATAAMCLFDSLDRLDAKRLSGTKEDGWYIPNAREAMRDGRILFAGKYSAPDYELITAEKCPLAVESMMIGHASDIKEQLEQLGIAVLMDQSSNEQHPMGRVEWIKLYGVLLDEEEKAEEVFNEQVSYLENVENKERTDKTVAFFYVSSTGKIITRKSGDYVSKMIDLAGGTYVFSDLGDWDSMTSSVTLDPEYFYTEAKDADVIIYNSTTTEKISSIDDLIAKCDLLSDFKAVKNGDVWCTEKNMYQEATSSGEMIRDINEILSGTSDEEEIRFFFRLK